MALAAALLGRQAESHHGTAALRALLEAMQFRRGLGDFFADLCQLRYITECEMRSALAPVQLDVRQRPIVTETCYRSV